MEVRKGGKEYFNKRYIKEHPEYLFVFEDTLEDEEYEKYDNVFPIPTYDERGNYFKDKHLDRNKIIIKDALREILNEVKKRRYKRLVIPEKSIGKGKSKLYDRQPDTYDYIKGKMKELLEQIEKESSSNIDTYRYERDRYGRDKYSRYRYERDRYGRNKYGRDKYDRDIFGRRISRHRNRGYKYHYSKSRRNNSNNNYYKRSKKYGRRLTKKELRKKRNKKQKTRKIKIDSVPKASGYAQKRCNACIRLKSLLKRPFTAEKRKGDKFVNELEKAEEKCLQCHEICKYLDENIKQDMPDFNIYKAKYPSICLVDEKGSKRVFRLMNSYRKKLLEQIEHFDLNLEKE